MNRKESEKGEGKRDGEHLEDRRGKEVQGVLVNMECGTEWTGQAWGCSHG